MTGKEMKNHILKVLVIIIDCIYMAVSTLFVDDNLMYLSSDELTIVFIKDVIIFTFIAAGMFKLFCKGEAKLFWKTVRDNIKAKVARRKEENEQ